MRTLIQMYLTTATKLVDIQTLPVRTKLSVAHGFTWCHVFYHL